MRQNGQKFWQLHRMYSAVRANKKAEKEKEKVRIFCEIEEGEERKVIVTRCSS